MQWSGFHCWLEGSYYEVPPGHVPAQYGLLAKLKKRMRRRERDDGLKIWVKLDTPES